MSEPGAPGAADHGSALIVRPPVGHAVAVATDELLARLDSLRALGDEARRGRTAVVVAQQLGALAGAAGAAGIRCTLLLEASAAHLQALESRALELDHAARVAFASYEAAELAVARAQRTLAELVAAGAATVGRAALGTLLLLVIANPGLLVALALAAPTLATAGREAGGALAAALRAHPELVSSPEFVALVRLIATSSDDAVLAGLGLPPAVSHLLGDDGLGVTGVAFGAGAVIAGGSALGVLRETPVRVEQTGVRSGAAEGAPTGSADRLARVPDGVDQVRLERYTVPGEPPRWIVYVSPTVDFAVTGGEPFDQTANVHAVAGGDPGSLRAVEQAMVHAGVGAGDEVHFVGYSQGGAIAARAVESGAWNAVGLETYGAPVGNVELPAHLHGFTVSHTDDLVPALAGPDARDSLVHLERRAYLAGEAMPTIDVPPHQKSAYAETAALIDAAESELVHSERAHLDGFAADYLARPGGELTVFDYHAERLAPLSASASR